MAEIFLLIDGYNLLYAAGLGQADYAPGDLLRARRRLLRYLVRRLRTSELDRTTVVFDAREPPVGFPHSSMLCGMRVLFATPDGDADAVIEDLIDRHSAPKRLTLVSSDHRLQQAARRRRAMFLDSDAFLDDLERRASVSFPEEADESDDPKETGEMSPAELAHWQAVFGTIDPAGLQADDLQAHWTPAPSLPEAPPKLQSTGSAAAGDAAPAPEPHRRRPATETPIFSEEWLRELQAWIDRQQ
jgi:predicted RNA-binding protein with PIN domain